MGRALMSGMLPTVSPATSYLTLIKWGLIGALLIAVLVGGIVFVNRVNGWRADSQALPAVTDARDAAIKERDDARQAKADEEVKFVGTLGKLGEQFGKLQGDLVKLQSQIERDRADRQTAYNNFLEATRNVPIDAPLGSDGDLLVRRGLLDLLRNPDTGLLSRGSGSDGAGGDGAGVSGAAPFSHPVPGQPAGADHQDGKAVVPAAGLGGRQGAKRAAEGRRRRRDHLGTGRARRAADAGSELRQAVPGQAEVIAHITGRRCGKLFASKVMTMALVLSGVQVIHG
jgi:hypothetical protein